MVLTVRISLAGRTGGLATCTRTLDTGIVREGHYAVRYGDLGGAPEVVCEAYGGTLAMTPPYEVTCSEPGAPTPGAAWSSR